MVKDTQTVIEYVKVSRKDKSSLIMLMAYSTIDREFNELVNMNSSELEEWLKGESSQGAGWAKSDDSGETIGHER